MSSSAGTLVAPSRLAAAVAGSLVGALLLAGVAGPSPALAQVDGEAGDEELIVGGDDDQDPPPDPPPSDGGGSGGGEPGAGDGSGDSGSGGDGSDPGPGDDGDPGDGDGGPPPWSHQPRWGTDPETDLPCIELVRRTDVLPGSLQAVVWELQTWDMLNDPRLGGRYPFCPGEVGADGAPLVSPAEAAIAFVRRLPLPPPGPRLAPGFALTGLPTYLELDGPVSHHAALDIPGWGRLDVDLTVVGVEVDWGDGGTSARSGPVRGAPYGGDPAAQISHTYRDRNADGEVAVTAHWRATWSLAGFGGVVTGLDVTRRVPHPVIDHRAVRASPTP